MVLQAVKKEPAIFATNEELVEKVKNKEIDGALIFTINFLFFPQDQGPTVW